MKNIKPESAEDIEKIALNILKGSKSLGVLPTPVNKIIGFTELQLSMGVDLSKVHPDFVTKKLEVLKNAIRKVLGAIDIREKTIYLDLTLPRLKIRFIKLHETGHYVLPWQRRIYEYLDDEKTLDPETKKMCEVEANFFASCTLFQLDRFEEEARRLPLSLGSAMALAKKFGSSNHSALRRFVEYSPKRCALIVLENLNSRDASSIKIRDYFQSIKFTSEFGNIDWSKRLGVGMPFIQDMYSKRRFHEDGSLNITFDSQKPMSFKYHFFNNSYNTFVFITPLGEFNRSKTKIIVSS